MLGVILSESAQIMIQILLAIAAVTSSFIAVAMYRNTRSKELAKQKDLDETNKTVMGNTCCINDLEKSKASTEYVDKQIKDVHNKFGDMKKDIEYVRGKTDDIYKMLFELKK